MYGAGNKYEYKQKQLIIDQLKVLQSEKQEIENQMNKSFVLTLKPIGRMQQKAISKPYYLSNNNHVFRQRSQFSDEQIPTLQQQKSTDDQKIKKSKNLIYTMIEDPKKTTFAYKKFLIMEKLLFLLTFVGFFLSLIKTEVDEKYGTQHSATLCNLISIQTLALILCIFLRYLTLFQLKIHQKKIFVYNFSQWSPLIITFLSKSSQQVWSMLIEMSLIVVHPNHLLIGSTVSIYQSFDQVYLTHEVNDILALISLIRGYIILRSLVNITVYSSPRSSRLCQQNGVDHNLLYSIKCILNQQPLKAIGLVFVVMLMFLGVGLKLSEGVLAKDNILPKPTGFQQYNNCFWCVFITMGTIGYGDYFPKTILGRLVIFATALTGVVLSSLLIVSLSSYLQMQASQSKSHITLMRLDEQSVLKQQATGALCRTIQLFRKMSHKQQKGSKLKSIFSDLKRKIDLVKIRTRKVKSLVDTDNILQEMNRLFQILKDNLRDIYQNQVIMKTVIQKIKIPHRVNKSVKHSFVKEMQKAIQIL